MFNRRETLGLLGAGGAALALNRSALARSSSSQPLPPAQQWLALLADAIADEIDSRPAIEGRLPREICGTLYRNGPGLFERDGCRKRTILDGDGMIRASTFADGGVRFRTRFVATEKFRREQRAKRFLYPTWTTPAPGFFSNFPEIPRLSQAGVSTIVKDGILYAFDEVGHPYAIDPESLATLRPVDPRGAAQGDAIAFKAHTKTDGATGAWVLAGTSGSPHQQLHGVLIKADGSPLLQTKTANPRGDYFHDFFWTGRHIVYHLHPAPLSPLPMLVGMRPYAENLAWRPELGSILLIVDPDDSAPPIRLEAPASWMWHAVNAYERDNTIIADFIGFDAPDHFFGPRAIFRTIMSGHAGVAHSPGKLRRFVLDMGRRTARMETLIGEHLEFPMINPRFQGLPYRFAYCAIGDIARTWFHDGLAKIDLVSGRVEQFRFGSQAYLGEPVFVPRPDSQAEDSGWLVCELLDGGSKLSSLLVFDAQAVSAGPIAQVKFQHHLPFSFHGWWQAA
jgi:all-trans-8'-apo-beta-carotenal 15,15'-oxygenase